MKPFQPAKTILLSILLTGTTFLAFGWDNPGHMTVAGLAYDELTSNEQTKLVALLKLHPGMELVTRGFPTGTPDGRILVMAMATWPDLSKNAKDLGYEDVGYEATNPAVTAVQFDHKMHKGYHFIDTPLWVGTGPAGDLPAIPDVNAVGVVNVLVAQLGSGEADTNKAYDLGWLLHLVGDMHQPLHACDGVSENYPKGDVGGNDIKIQGVTKGESELHGYWDDILGKTAKSDPTTHHPRLDKDVMTADQIIVGVQGLPLGANSESVDPSVWAGESFQMAKEDVYSPPIQSVESDSGSQLKAELDDAYNEMAVRDARARMRVAGHRLCLILKQVLD